MGCTDSNPGGSKAYSEPPLAGNILKCPKECSEGHTYKFPCLYASMSDPNGPMFGETRSLIGFMREERGLTPQAIAVVKLLGTWFDQFQRKSQDYQNSGGNVSQNFGVLGQYMKLADKILKLRRPLWDERVGPPSSITTSFNFESTQEILDDIIGHAFLLKIMLEEEVCPTSKEEM